jgi:hypothetical protein
VTGKRASGKLGASTCSQAPGNAPLDALYVAADIQGPSRFSRIIRRARRNENAGWRW